MDNFTRVKNTLKLTQVVEEDVQLKRSGRYLKACCPFHGEKTPSFTVYPGTQDFHCFGCGAHGTVVDYIMHRIGTRSAQEALLYISQTYGIQMDDVDLESIKKRKQTIDKKRSRAAELFKQIKQADDYLKGRSFTNETIKIFGLGYDRELDAITIPYLNTHGEVVGNSYRFLSADAPVKYKNDADDDVFKKSELLYGMDKARSTKKQLYIVEGYFDAMAIYQMGFPVVAYCGSSITDEQVQLIRNYIKPHIKLYLVPDNDDAGHKAAVKNVDKLRRLENRISVIELEEVKDANDLLMAGKRVDEIPATAAELYLLKRELDTCLEITDEYEVALQFSQNIRNEMLKQEMAKYLAGRWNESIERVSRHMSTDAPQEAKESDILTYTEVMMNYVKEVTEGEKRVVRYQYEEIDRLVPKGMRKAELIYLMGRSGSGKTSFSNNLKYNTFYHQKKRVLDFSLELAAEAMVPQLIQIHLDSTEKQIEHIFSGKEQYPETMGAFNEAIESRYRVIDKPVTIEDIRENIRLTNERIFAEPVDLVVIDYFGMIKLTGKKDPYNERSEIARTLKEIAKEFNTTILCLTQASREGGKDGSEPLTLAAARDTGAIEESGDYVLGIYRPGNSPNVDPHEKILVEKEMRIQVLKARWGRLGEALLHFEGSTKRVQNWPQNLADPRRT